MAGRFSFCLFLSVLLYACGVKEIEKMSFQMPPEDEIEILLQEASTILYLHRDTLWEWDSTRLDIPITLAKKRGVDLGFFRLLEYFQDPVLDQLPALQSYLKADSLGWTYNSLPFELGMPSSNPVYAEKIMLTWPADPEVKCWKVEWRNLYDETVDSSFTSVNRILVDLEEENERALYIRHPITREGSGVFMLSRMPEQDRKVHDQELAGLQAESLLHHLASAAYFESKGLYADALSCYVGRWDKYPEQEESKKRLANFMFRHVFPPFY